MHKVENGLVSQVNLQQRENDRCLEDAELSHQSEKDRCFEDRITTMPLPIRRLFFIRLFRFRYLYHYNIVEDCP